MTRLPSYPRSTMLSLAAIVLASSTACGDSGDDEGDGNGNGNGANGNGGLPQQGPELEAEAAFEVTAEGAAARLHYAAHAINQRVYELNTFVDGELLEAAEEIIGAPQGITACPDGGEVEIDGVEASLENPFSQEEETFEGSAYIFEDCDLGDAVQMFAGASMRLDGRFEVTEGGEETRRFLIEGPFTIDVDGEFLGETYRDVRSATKNMFVKPSTGTVASDNVIGTWASSYVEAIGELAEGGQFDLLGHGGEGDAELLMRSEFPDDDGNASDPAWRRLRVQVDARDDDGDDCIAPGRFDLETERVPQSELVDDEEAPDDTVQVHTVVGAGGAEAHIEPHYTEIGEGVYLAEGLEVTIDGETEVLSASEVSELQDEVRDSCVHEFTGFGL